MECASSSLSSRNGRSTQAEDQCLKSRQGFYPPPSPPLLLFSAKSYQKAKREEEGMYYFYHHLFLKLFSLPLRHILLYRKRKSLTRENVRKPREIEKKSKYLVFSLSLVSFFFSFLLRALSFNRTNMKKFFMSIFFLRLPLPPPSLLLQHTYILH